MVDSSSSSSLSSPMLPRRTGNNKSLNGRDGPDNDVTARTGAGTGASNGTTSAGGGAASSNDGSTYSPTRSGSMRSRDKSNDLDSMSSRRDSNGKSIPAWKLREQMKLNDIGRHSSSHRRTIPPSGTTATTTSSSSSTPTPGGFPVSPGPLGGRRVATPRGTFNKPSSPFTSSSSSPFSSVPTSVRASSMRSPSANLAASSGHSSGSGDGGGGLGVTRHGLRKTADIDPSLPPAFRAAFARQQQRKRIMNNDDFMSLDSVHSGKSRGSSYVAGTPTTAQMNDDDDDDDRSSSLGSESLDGHDSFASLGEDSDDDEAYRESKNMLARQEIEQQQRTTMTTSSARRKHASVKGVHGTPLDFIAE